MPVRSLPSNPDLNHLRSEAKDLLREHAAQSASVAQRLREFHPRFQQSADAEIFAARLSLGDARLAIAREHGFPSWTRLKRHVETPTLGGRLDLPHHERIENAIFRQAVELLDAGDVSGLRVHLKRHPTLVRRRVTFEGTNYFRNPSLLEFIAENPIRRGMLPGNIVAVAEAILDAGPDQSALNETLLLVATGRVPRECRLQLPLIDLLCNRGADPSSAIEAAALHGELQAVHALIGRGARMTLPIAAALGRTDDARLLFPAAAGPERHLALAFSSQFGHAQIVRLLLDAGEDPNRYNPVGGHSHSTPLHEAAGAGHAEVVRLLVERGAKLDQKDVLWRATPAGWAAYAGRTELAEYLHSAER